MDLTYQLANKVKPTQRQLLWQKTEFYALISYGLPVFNGKQYGDGFTPPSVFGPEAMDTDQWCETAKKAGMKGVVLTCKHYDGFCLWPTKLTDYSVKSSNWLNGEGDLVRLVSESCKKYGLKFGIYVAPWDRHEKSYGTGKAYDDFFCGLLTELLTDYGEVFTVHLDGICGADADKMQDYDWKRYYALIRRLAPDAVISFMGPDVRYVGNERGATRSEEWSPLPAYMGVYENGTTAPAPKKRKSVYGDLDLGSRKAIKDNNAFIWYPCEVSVPMRSHWFFDDEDKYSVKTKDKLIKLYNASVGNNSCLMLGLSPNKRGVLDDTDTQILTALGVDIKMKYSAGLLPRAASIKASSNEKNATAQVFARSSECFWKPDSKDKKPELTVTLGEDNVFDVIALGENIANGQHIEGFEILALNEKNKWKTIASGSTVGYQKICAVAPMRAKQIKIRFTEYRDFFELSYLFIN